MMMWGWGYSVGWPMLLWTVLWNLFWLALLGVVVWALIRWALQSPLLGIHRGTMTAEPSALEILRQRYARGEIDTPTFERMRERLEGARETSR